MLALSIPFFTPILKEGTTMGFTNDLTPAQIDRHRAIWELRVAVNDGRSCTDAEFAGLLARIGVTDADQALHAARLFMFRIEAGDAASISTIDPYEPVDLNNLNDPRNPQPCAWCKSSAILTKAPESEEMICPECRASIARTAILSALPEES